jgi:LAGLIDADG DNA endonuclease family
MYREGINSKVKMEQSHIHKCYIEHLFSIFKNFTFQEQLRERLELRGLRKGEVKSYEFRTFTHEIFNPI